MRHRSAISPRFAASGPAFLDYLRELRFTGEVRAVPEGTVLGPAEPLLEVTAPILEAQLVESAVLNLCHVQTVIASKAARVAIAAAGRQVAEFGMRRSHGVHAGLVSARSSWIAGCEQTSDVLAGATWALPLAGPWPTASSPPSPTSWRRSVRMPGSSPTARCC